MEAANPWQNGDFTGAKTYQESLNMVIEAQTQFDAMPSSIRSKFDNNPAKLMEFINKAEKTPDDYKEALKMGLIKVREPEKAINVNVTNQPEKASKATPEKETK